MAREARDSLFGERILWSGGPKVISTPAAARLTAGVCAVVSIVTLLFAIVCATALKANVGGMLVFAAWCATLGLAAWRGPILWRAGVEYVVTERHVIWRRGRIRRSIDRHAVSYALIRWNPSVPGVGDLVLVRAVPTGALRRTLNLTLSDVAGPDRLWAIVRGLTPSAPLGDGERSLGQRLDDGERVLWTGTPQASPWTIRRALTASVAGMVALATLRVILRATPALGRVLRAHALPWITSGLLIAGVVLTTLLLVSVAVGVAYQACVRPQRLARRTRYLVTDRRVLIRRGSEELSLDRARIADIIATPTKGLASDASPPNGGPGLTDVFLVLDGPQARAFSPSGAFGERDGDKLVPVLSAIEDAETVGSILRAKPEGLPLPHAA
jgi:hypothetical protein